MNNECTQKMGGTKDLQDLGTWQDYGLEGARSKDLV